MIVPDVDLCYKLLNQKGIDAYKGATQLKPVEAPVGSKFESPKETNEFFPKILYLPIHKNVPMEEIIRICREVVNTVDIVKALKIKRDAKL